MRVLGRRIRAVREKKGLERKELAKLIEISYHQLYQIEARTQRTQPSTLKRIADALNVEPSIFVVCDFTDNGGSTPAT